MADDVLTRNENDELAVRVVSTSGDTSTNPNDVYTRDENGKLCVRVTGGGGDQHNLGYFATLQALQEAHPTAEAGDWAIVGATDSVWIWDTDTSAWVDSDQKGQVTSVNNQTGAVTLDINDVAPTQTGNAGKFLTTDGTDASWATINALTNQATGTDSLSIGNYNISQNESVLCGYGSLGIGKESVGVGYMTGDGFVGANYRRTISIGHKAFCSADGAIQIGTGTNSEARTLQVGFPNSGFWSANNYKLLNSDGTIPKERLANVVSTPSTMPTLTVAGWSNNTQTVNVTGVTATNVVFVSPAPASAADYASAGIVCTAQGAGTLTFTCTTTPTNAITVNVVCL